MSEYEEPLPPNNICPVDGSCDIDENDFGQCKCIHCGCEWVRLKTKQEIYQALAKDYLSQETIAREAYAIWEMNGRLDGEAFCQRSGMKNREVDWMLACMKLETLCEFDAESLHIMLTFEVGKYKIPE